MHFFFVLFCGFKNKPYLCTRNQGGAIAQLVEQRTENPCVPGSIPGGTTPKEKLLSEKIAAFFVFSGWSYFESIQ